MTTSRIRINQEASDSGSKEVIELSGIGKKFPLAETRQAGTREGQSELWALKGVSLKIGQGEIFGVIGRNGAGKTTLLNILAGTISASVGTINTRGRIAGLFNLGVGFQDELSGKENIFLNGTILGATHKELAERIDSIIEFSELGEFIHQPLGAYSQGMRLRLGFSIIVNLDFDILVIDEVLAVGDALFQDKCFRRIAEFRRAGKTLVVASQDMDLMARLCNRGALLDHGRLLFIGNVSEGIARYRQLLNTEKFFVGPQNIPKDLVRKTKRWTEDISGWGNRRGTQDASIESVKFIDRLGRVCRKIKSGQPLKVRVDFNVNEGINNPHFGIAVFRPDGVYCYGPNTKFDNQSFSYLGPGDYSFFLNYKNFFLAPGLYKVSVAIWDENETIPYDYHDGCYDLQIDGSRESGELISMPYRNNQFTFLQINKPPLILQPKEGLAKTGIVGSLILSNSRGEQKNSFFTGESVKFTFDLKETANIYGKGRFLWCGIYRDDGIYCQGVVAPIRKSRDLSMTFPEFLLLPGGYKISYGIWGCKRKDFVAFYPNANQFDMVFRQEDHGTIYLNHSWKLKRRAIK